MLDHIQKKNLGGGRYGGSKVAHGIVALGDGSYECWYDGGVFRGIETHTAGGPLTAGGALHRKNSYDGNVRSHLGVRRNKVGAEVKAFMHLLVYDALLILSYACAIWLAKSTKEQFTQSELTIGSLAKILCTVCALIPMCLLVMYLSGVMTYATAR